MQHTHLARALFSVIGALALAASAQAHPAGTPAGGMFAQMDADHDGRISAHEHAAAAQAMFQRMDANHDGRVTSAEMAAGRKMRMSHGGDHDADDMQHGGMQHDGMQHDGMQGMHEQMLAKMDADHDGTITWAEAQAQMRTMFDRMDANHDGKVNSDEMRAGHAAMEAMHDAPGHDAGDGRAAMRHGDMGDMHGMPDRNHDGIVTAAEHAARAEAKFARADANHDGFVTPAEMAAMHKSTP